MKRILLIMMVLVGLILSSSTLSYNQTMTIEHVLVKDKEIKVGSISNFKMNRKSLEKDSCDTYNLPLKFNSTDTVALMSFVYKKKAYEFEISPNILELGGRYNVTIRFNNNKEGNIYWDLYLFTRYIC